MDVVDTARDASELELPPLLVREPLEEFLDAHGIGEGRLEAERIGDGHSNITFLVQRGDARVVLRRPPRPPLPPSAHDVLREARLLAALDGSGVPVPKVLARGEDEAVIGAPFYVMEHVDGVVVTAETPAALAEERAAIASGLLDALVALHAVDWEARGLGDFGRPSGYLERQVKRFAGLWEAGRTRELPALDAVTEWLRAHVPESRAATIVHGDYRLGNLLLGAEPPARVLAVLDWEMATLGDPLADLGYLAASWTAPGEPDTPMHELSGATREPGWPSREELVGAYGERTGHPVSELDWYRVLALWKSAIFLEQSYKRYLSGAEEDPWFEHMAEGVPALVEEARRLTGT
jgi:aminoglycoside phosphotransferase (APT) family kinase protein